MTGPTRGPRPSPTLDGPDFAYRGSGVPGVPVERNPGAADRIPPDPRGQTPRQRAAAAGWLLAWEVARALPEALVHAAADLGGRIAARRAGGARARLRANLARVEAATGAVGDLDVAATAALRSYARYWVESFRAADLSPQAVDRRTTTGGFAHLDAALQRGRGVIVLLAHHGSWDVAAQWGETHGYHLAVVAEVVRPRALFERFVRLRETVGLEIVPLRRRDAVGASGGDGLVAALAPALAANHMVGLLSDRDLSGRGPLVKLFGEEAHLPRGAAILAARTGAAIVPSTMLQRPGRRWHLQVLPEVEVAGLDAEAATVRVARALEDLVLLDPVQWHCVSPVWQTDRAHRGHRR